MSFHRATTAVKSLALTLVLFATSLLAQTGPSWSEAKLQNVPQAQASATGAVFIEVRTSAPVPDISDDPIGLVRYQPSVLRHFDAVPQMSRAIVVYPAPTSSPLARAPPAAAL